MLVSVIIPAYNAAGRISATLEALRNQTLPAHDYEVVVVDDGSGDDTAAVSAGLGARVVRQVNQGPAAARNHGAQEAHGEILVFTDDDCIPEPEFLSEIILPLLQNPEVVGVQGSYRTRQQELAARFIQVEIEERYERMAQFDAIDFIGTYAAAYRREIFLRHGGFDTRYRQASGEDIDLSFRLHEKGYRMVFHPAAVVFHTHPASVSHLARVKSKRGFWHIRLGSAHPGRMVKNCYTPPTLKYQVLSIPLFFLCLLLLPWQPLAAGGMAAILAMFFWQSRAMMRLFAQHGYAMGGLLPLLSMVRAGALGVGMFFGVMALLRSRLGGDRGH